ncbi:MAG: alkaline phytoceramidase [Betaproteobacteria bacterium]|nr:alkaline phytoceramidase [Betaproteobacteria bacterium]
MKTPHHALPLLLTILLAAAALFHGPIAPPAGYHDFADQKHVFGIPHFADVISNLGFAAVALWGWIKLAPASRHAEIQAGWAGYRLFLIGLFLTALGSSWYHLAPDNASLVWDRLPIALACGGLLAGVRGDVQRRDSRRIAAWLALAAIVSVAWWYYTDLSGQGDLRPYLLLQVLPILLIPLWQWTCQAPAADRLAFGAALALYVVAKFAELNDHEIAAALGVVSGHTLKHLLAGGAAALIVGRLAGRVRAPVSACAGACPPAPPSAMNACR